MSLHNCRTPVIVPGLRTFKAGSQWKCKARDCGQLWIAQPLNKTISVLVWKRK